ncbi:hypothetical protein [Marinicellulosiphila megalodicopiae]|uniref:hypothetical protein n=1 Tax=Marinicellulosiphila megalodicopiae TaxID=2724896 RepID=UPI003BB1326D
MNIIIYSNNNSPLINISEELDTLNILNSIELALPHQSMIALYCEAQQSLINRATFKLINWLKVKFNLALPLRLHKVNSFGDDYINFTLRCTAFSQILFFNIEFNINGDFEFTSDTGFNANTFIRHTNVKHNHKSQKLISV